MIFTDTVILILPGAAAAYLFYKAYRTTCNRTCSKKLILKCIIRNKLEEMCDKSLNMRLMGYLLLILIIWLSILIFSKFDIYIRLSLLSLLLSFAIALSSVIGIYIFVWRELRAVKKMLVAWIPIVYFIVFTLILVFIILLFFTKAGLGYKLFFINFYFISFLAADVVYLRLLRKVKKYTLSAKIRKKLTAELKNTKRVFHTIDFPTSVAFLIFTFICFALYVDRNIVGGSYHFAYGGIALHLFNSMLFFAYLYGEKYLRIRIPKLRLEGPK